MTTKTDEQERAAFEAWWEKEGQYYRSYGGDYEKTFAYLSYQSGRAALQSQDREDAQRRQIADLVLGHAEGMSVSSELQSRQGFGDDTEHYFQISDGKTRYGVIITLTRLTDIDHARRIEGGSHE